MGRQVAPFAGHEQTAPTVCFASVASCLVHLSTAHNNRRDKDAQTWIYSEA